MSAKRGEQPADLRQSRNDTDSVFFTEKIQIGSARAFVQGDIFRTAILPEEDCSNVTHHFVCLQLSIIRFFEVSTAVNVTRYACIHRPDAVEKQIGGLVQAE